MSPATTPPPKTWSRVRVSATDLNREIRDQLRDMQSRVIALQAGGGGVFYPVGTIIAWSGSTIPNGWFLCDGSIRSSNNEPGLALAIGNAYNTGGEAPLEFRLPKLNDALPRCGSGLTGDGSPKSVGIGAGQNSVTWTHSQSFNVTSATNAAGAHNHGGSFTYHNSVSSSEHTWINDHSHNYNGLGTSGGHNHVGYAAGGTHDHGGTNAAGANVSRPTGNALSALGHSHNVSAEGSNTSSVGNHTHNVSSSSGASGNNVGVPNASAGSFDISNATHTHDTSHTHSFNQSHPSVDLVPPSVSVNYIIKR